MTSLLVVFVTTTWLALTIQLWLVTPSVLKVPRLISSMAMSSVPRPCIMLKTRSMTTGVSFTDGLLSSR